MKVFFVYCIVHVLLVSLGVIAVYQFHKKELYNTFLRLHLFFEFSILSYFFYLVIHNTLVKRIILGVFVFFVIANAFYFKSEEFSGLTQIPTLFEFLFFISCIIYFFFESVFLIDNSSAYSSIAFWLAVGLLIYFCGEFFYMLLVENSKNAPIEIKNQLIIVYAIVAVIKNSILAFSFFNKNQKRDNHSDFTFSIPKDLNLDTYTPKNTTP